MVVTVTRPRKNAVERMMIMETSPSPSTAFDSQVGGHGGILSSSDGAVIIKPCLPLEASFYKTVVANGVYSQLATIVPQFYGTLTLHGHLDEQGAIVEARHHGHSPSPDSETEKDEPFASVGVISKKEPYNDDLQHLVLENLTYTFSKPNVIDIKLGTVLWGEDASPEKRLRMEKTARATTSHETGIRITGFNIYDYTENKVIHTSKEYGKSLKEQDLPTGISKCFPLVASGFPSGQGLPRDLLKQVLEGIIIEIKNIIDVLNQIDCYMAGVSLLIIYEADWDILKRTLQDWPPRRTSLSPEEEEEVEEEMDEEDMSAEEDIKDDDDGGEESENTRVPYVAKLIDFAHTSLEKKRDTGIIRGLETTVELLSGRLKEILDVPL